MCHLAPQAGWSAAPWHVPPCTIVAKPRSIVIYVEITYFCVQSQNKTLYVCSNCQSEYSDLDIDRLMDPMDETLKYVSLLDVALCLNLNLWQDLRKELHVKTVRFVLFLREEVGKTFFCRSRNSNRYLYDRFNMGCQHWEVIADPVKFNKYSV